ncbi:phage tail protein, partial [Escherichia coli]|nr:phage tail protein [Escherichia coli]
MAKSVITSAFIRLKAQQAVEGTPVVLDEFIFANVPDLNPETPVSPDEILPPEDQIVHRQAVGKTGVVNENAVVYSVTLGAELGDFEFNWVGLVSKATSTLAMIVHAPTQKKIRTHNGNEGNVLVRSMLMEYSGAKEATGITTPAQTWQIDFTARLASMDERQRRENVDIYGKATFFDDG